MTPVSHSHAASNWRGESQNPMAATETHLQFQAQQVLPHKQLKVFGKVKQGLSSSCLPCQLTKTSTTQHCEHWEEGQQGPPCHRFHAAPPVMCCSGFAARTSFQQGQLPSLGVTQHGNQALFGKGSAKVKGLQSKTCCTSSSSPMGREQRFRCRTV